MTNEPTTAAIEAAWQNESVFDLVTKMDEIGEPIPDPRHRAMAMVRFGYQKGYEAAKAAEWVNCEDEMPPKPPFRAKYLCRFSLGDYYDISVLQWWRTDGWTDEEGNVLDKAVTVTHWMPLPEYTGE